VATPAPPTTRKLAATTAIAAGLLLTGCGATDPATSTAGESAAETEAASTAQPLREAPPGPYDGPYNAAFAEEVGTYPETGEIGVYEGMEVSLTAEIGEVVSPIAVAITDPQDPSVAPLLVVLENADTTLRAGDPIEVTGTVHAAYNVPAVEENLGEAPEADVLAHYDGQPFIEATQVHSPIPAPSAPAG
jgi:hypothetical protein